MFFRKEMPQQDDLVERAKEIYVPLGAVWQEQKKQFRFSTGGRVRFRPLENVDDAEKYQGQNLSDAAVEEAGNYAMPAAIDRLFGALRSTAGVPVQLILTANPGGPGHHWIKVRYIDPAPLGFTTLRRELPNGDQHRYVYIPSRVQHNRILLANDPGYVSRLYLVGSSDLVRAWLDGDWNVIAGAFFPEFGPQHIASPVTLPPTWLRFRAMDWGSARPFSVGWYAVSDGDLDQFPRGALVKYREWYGVQKKPDGSFEPNVGVKLVAEQVADGILDLEEKKEVEYGVLDPSAFAMVSGPSIAERMFDRGVTFRRADNARVARKGAQGGWDQLRARLKGDEGRPMLYFFASCLHSIRTIPVLQHDASRAEDVDSDGEDHAADETRYACMSRPWVQDKKVARTAREEIRAATKRPTFRDAEKMHEQRHNRRARV